MRNKLLICILLCSICILPNLQLKSHPTEGLLITDHTNTGLIVITAIDNPVIEVAQEILKDNNHRWLVKYANDEGTIKDQLVNFLGMYVILVGHGTPEGLQLRTGVLSWIVVGHLYDISPAEVFFTASCYSTQLDTFSSKQTFGFTGPIDSYVAAKDIGKIVSLNSEKLRTVLNFQASDYDPLYEYRRMNPRKDFMLYYYYTIKIAATDGLVAHLQVPWNEGGMGWGSDWAEDLENFVESSLAIFEPNFGIEFDVIEVVEFQTFSTSHDDLMTDAYSFI